MIVYESNKNWLRDLRHLYKSWTMQRVLRSTLVIMVVTCLLCVLFLEFIPHIKIGLDASIFSLLGVVLSILLSFRTTTAYDRWWEGRKNWGELVNNTRNLAIYSHSALPVEDQKTRHYLAVHISNFCIALKEHLRKGVVHSELINVSPEEMEKYKSKSHLPSHIAYEIVQRLQDVYKAGNITNEDHLNIKLHTQELMNVAGACERIKKTPIPFSYNVYLKLFITLYAIFLPFALIPIFGYWSVLMVGFVFFAFLGLELMAEEIEDPFGLDCNDLPTGDIAHTIKNNVFEILEAKHIEQEVQKEEYSKIF
jgi:putative membrane protein